MLGLWNSYCIPIPEKWSGKGSSQSVPYVRLYCSRGLVCFLKEKFNRRTLYKFYFRSWLQAPKLFEYLAKEVDRKKGIPEKPSQGHTAYGPCKGKRHRGGTERTEAERFTCTRRSALRSKALADVRSPRSSTFKGSYVDRFCGLYFRVWSR